VDNGVRLLTPFLLSHVHSLPVPWLPAATAWTAWQRPCATSVSASARSSRWRRWRRSALSPIFSLFGRAGTKRHTQRGHRQDQLSSLSSPSQRVGLVLPNRTQAHHKQHQAFHCHNFLCQRHRTARHSCRIYVLLSPYLRWPVVLSLLRPPPSSSPRRRPSRT